MALEYAVLICKAKFGAAWYHDPALYPTSDGVVPYRLVFPTVKAALGLSVLDALMTARGIGLAFADESHADAAMQRALDDVFPPAKV